jgi:hypothetical protein
MRVSARLIGLGEDRGEDAIRRKSLLCVWCAMMTLIGTLGVQIVTNGLTVDDETTLVLAALVLLTALAAAAVAFAYWTLKENPDPESRRLVWVGGSLGVTEVVFYTVWWITIGLEAL